MMKARPRIKSTNALQWFMQSALGNVVARSWLEHPLLYALEKWFFPTSRLWAAATVAKGDINLFLVAIPKPVSAQQRVRIENILVNLESKRQQNEHAEQAWRDAFFNDTQLSIDELAELEKRRIYHRNEFNKTRGQFSFLRNHLESSVSPQFSSPDEAAQLYAPGDEEDAKLFLPPKEMPPVAVSHKIEKTHSVDYWLRFDSPSARTGDTVYARVLEPKGVVNPPTLIFGHGIGVEFDHWRNLVDIVKYLPQLGIRVIRPEAPWHGRRTPEGYYGGEYFLSTTPVSGFDFFAAQHREWAVLMDWARRTSDGRVAIGGSSLGAQTAQNVAIRAAMWPQHLQPDALLLMTHCSHLWEVALDGDLADIWNLHRPLKQMGWSRKITEQWMQRLDATGEPCMPPKNIISVLGRTDGVTPYRSGRRLQKLWELPPENCFNWPCGHFEVPLRMARQQQPLHRLRDILLA